MKSFSLFKLSTSLMAFAALVFATSVQAAAPAGNVETGKAEVKIIRGSSATYSDPSGQLGILKVGQVISEKSTITTGPGTLVELWLGENGQVLRLIENTSVTIEELKVQKNAADTVAKTTLNLKQGGLIGNVKKLSAASDYKIKYAEGVAGIRGTDWAILPGKGVVCSEGTVTVTFVVNGVPSAPITLAAGQIALPPATPGGVPRILDLPRDVTDFLVAVGHKFDGHGPDGPRGPQGRDVVVIVSAQAGEGVTSDGTPSQTLTPINND
jgi:hypothetical protein